VSKGRLISFEGLDGAGKTTQIELLERWLQSRRVAYIRTREPGGTPLGVEIRTLLLNRPDLAITPLAEAFLFQADRAQHFTNVVLPALDEGKLVITDRFFDASIAYQGYARGLGAKLIESLSLIATQGRIPDLTILLDLSPVRVHERTDIAQERNEEANNKVDVAHQLSLPLLSEVSAEQIGLREEQNRFDTEVEKFHRLVREGFREIANAHPERIKSINASLSVKQIHQRVISLIEPLMYMN
jgi:dTMP kinase